jgi:hypothetical protein
MTPLETLTWPFSSQPRSISRPPGSTVLNSEYPPSRIVWTVRSNSFNLGSYARSAGMYSSPHRPASTDAAPSGWNLIVIRGADGSAFTSSQSLSERSTAPPRAVASSRTLYKANGKPCSSWNGSGGRYSTKFAGLRLVLSTTSGRLHRGPKSSRPTRRGHRSRRRGLLSMDRSRPFRTPTETAWLARHRRSLRSPPRYGRFRKRTVWLPTPRTCDPCAAQLLIPADGHRPLARPTIDQPELVVTAPSG